MSLFKREEKPKRDINEILSPKEANENEIEVEEMADATYIMVQAGFPLT